MEGETPNAFEQVDLKVLTNAPDVKEKQFIEFPPVLPVLRLPENLFEGFGVLFSFERIPPSPTPLSPLDADGDEETNASLDGFDLNTDADPDDIDLDIFEEEKNTVCTDFDKLFELSMQAILAGYIPSLTDFPQQEEQIIATEPKRPKTVATAEREIQRLEEIPSRRSRRRRREVVARSGGLRTRLGVYRLPDYEYDDADDYE